METLFQILDVILVCVCGGLVGIAMMSVAAAVLPRFLDSMTPNIDESKEIVRGNRAVADYFGKVVSAAILGASLIIAASVLGGILAVLH